MTLHTAQPSAQSPYGPAADAVPVLFRYGFRPFFLLAGLAACGFLLAWMAVLMTGAWPAAAMDATHWHAHEMLFGFAAAAIAGFLLTAVPSWTGTTALSGWPLAALVGLWLAGRVALFPWVGVPALAAALIDLCFLPALGVALAGPLVKAGKWRNSAFLGLLGLLTAGNLLIHLDRLGPAPMGGHQGLGLTLGVVLMMVTVIGGRIVPAFTRNGLAAQRIPATVVSHPWVERATLGLTALLIPAELLFHDGVVTGVVALAAAVAHGVRLSGWQGWKARRSPILWVLHVGYLWVVVGLALKGLHPLTGLVPESAGVHALTAGAFATMILAVMSRAALGHTGRPLVAARPTVAAYAVLSVAAACRVLAPILPAEWFLPVLGTAGIAWIAAFALYLVAYVPVLLSPRADGRPG